jgi:hypothetical protein
MPLPTLPKPHRRSRNRSRRNKNIPFNAAAGTPKHYPPLP